MNSSGPVIWEPLPRSARPFVLKWVLPILGLCTSATLVAFISPRNSLVALGLVALALPFLLQAAESRWERLKGRPIRIDRHGMRVGELSVRWSEVLEVEFGPVFARRVARTKPQIAIKFRIGGARRHRPQRSLIWTVGLYPGDGYFDFYVGPDYSAPIDEMARVIEAARRQGLATS